MRTATEASVDRCRRRLDNMLPAPRQQRP